MRKILLFLSFLWLALSANGQYYIQGQEPCWVKWRQHKGDFGKLIYPKGNDSLANQFLRHLETSLEVVPTSLNHTPKRFPVVFHPNSILSNGFVSWAPKRMEVVATPSLDADPEPWLYTLALHETRHIVQIDKLWNGFFKPAYYIFGEHGIGPAAALVPMWFLEGDAVYTETALSQGGRGRQASFYQHYRTHLLHNNGSRYSYDKWLMGSYKDQIPNHYQFGYQMVGYANHRYGSAIWSNALEYVYKRPYTLFPFYFSLKRDVGLSRKGLFKEAMAYNDSLWRNSKPLVENEVHNLLLKRHLKGRYVEYKYPYLANDSTLFALKVTLSRTPALVIIDVKTGKEKVLHRPGYIIDRVSYSPDAIYWSQYRAHSRWEYLNYAEVWKFNLKTGLPEQISRRTRYFNPIPINGTDLAVVENTPTGHNFITIISQKGDLLERVSIPSTLELKEIVAGDDEEIFSRCSSPNGTVILRYPNFQSEPDTILGPVFKDISNLAYLDGHILFTATNSYIEEAFRVDPKTGIVTAAYSSAYGLTNLSVSSNGKVVASEYFERGMQPVVLSKSQSSERQVDLASINTALFINNEQIMPKKSFAPSAAMASEKYSKVKNLFHFHSWAPLYFNPLEATSGDVVDVYPGVTLISQNLTSTLVSSIAYSYGETHGVHANAEWLGWYPKFSVGFDAGNEFGKIYGGPLAENSTGKQDRPRVYFYSRVRLPYRLSSGYVFSEVNLGLRYQFTNSLTWNYRKEMYIDGLSNIEPYISFYALTRMAYQDLKPRLGAYFYVGETSSPGIGGNLLGKTLLASYGVYLPGLFTNHSLQFSGQLENQNLGLYFRSSRVTIPRGFREYYLFDYLGSVYDQTLTANAEYAFPIIYPDLPIGPVVYLKRIFANAFSDNARLNVLSRNSQGRIVSRYEYLQSAGVELVADMHFFRTPWVFQLGYQAGVRLNDNSFFHGVSFWIDMNSIYGFSSKNSFARLSL